MNMKTLIGPSCLAAAALRTAPKLMLADVLETVVPEPFLVTKNGARFSQGLPVNGGLK